MNKLLKCRYFIAFILSLVLFFAVIISLHSYYNLKSIVQPPSQLWGRSTSLGADDLYKKKPSIIVNDKSAEILTANKSNFTKIRIDRATRETVRESFEIKGVETYRVQKFAWDENNIYFIERDNLYFAVKNSDGEYSAKTLIAEKVKDFEIINSKDGTAIIAAKEEGLAIYKENNSSFQQYGTIYDIDNLVNLSAIEDNNGVMHIAANAKNSVMDFTIYYLLFSEGQWSLRGSATEKFISDSWSINTIDIGIDDTDVYIFYEMTKWDKGGQTARIYNAVVPQGSDVVDLKFNRFYISEKDAVNPFLYLGEPRVIKTQDNEIKLTVIKDTYDKKYSNSYSVFYLTMDNGKITNTTAATGNHRLIVSTANAHYEDDIIFVYMDAAGGFNYEAFYTETGKEYYNNAAQATKADVYLAIMETVPGYVSTFLLSFIKLMLYFPAIIWFLAIELFEIKSMKDRPKLTFAIGFIIFLIIKLATFGNYYTELSISQMPPILTFAGAKYVYAIGIAVIALLIQKLLKKHNHEMHVITEYVVFALIDIEYTNLLFASYLV